MLDTRTSTHAAPPSPIGELVEANSRLERRVGELLLVQDVAQSITSELRLDALLELAVTTVASLTSAHAVSILLVDPARGCLVERAQRGVQRRAVNGGLSAWIAHQEVPLLLRDVAAAGQFAALAGAEASEGGSFVGVPLVFEGRTLGVVSAAEKAGGLAFEERDLRLLVCLAPHLAIAIRNAELHAEVGSHLHLAHGRPVRNEDVTPALAAARALAAKPVSRKPSAGGGPTPAHGPRPPADGLRPTASAAAAQVR